MSLLERRKAIQAKPVIGLVRVTKAEWQPAIEAALGGSLQALVVEPGKEIDATRFMRGLRGEEVVYRVSIVRPSLLQDDLQRTPAAHEVASLIEGDDPVAVAYLRHRLGTMRMVDTEEELGNWPRTLTRDGMMTTSGGNLRLELPTRLQIGARNTDADFAELRGQLARLVAEASAIEERLRAIAEALTLVTQVGAGDEVRPALQTRIAEALETEDECQRIQRVLDTYDEGDIARLRRMRDEAATEEEVRELNVKVGQLRSEARHTESDICRLRELLAGHTTKLEAARGNDLYDEGLARRLRAELDGKAGTERPLAERVTEAERRAELANRRTREQIGPATTALTSYLAQHGIQREEEKTDWRKALAWVCAEKKRLEETELQNYREKLEEARAKAEEAVRNDIALKLGDNIQLMQDRIHKLNAVMRAAPPFSNGETYEFTARPAEPYKAFLAVIERARADGSGSFFEQKEAEFLLKLLDEQSMDKTGRPLANPLSDYRMLYSYDLNIYSGGKLFTTLSKRMGKGSGGEHKSPFYLMAGAALASAYRIEPRKDHDGLALMLLDEAFRDLDLQNSVAVARFLDQLGLQLVFAAPEDSMTKLLPVCHRMYNMWRVETSTYIKPVQLKQAARELLASDNVVDHPELLEQELERKTAIEPS